MVNAAGRRRKRCWAASGLSEPCGRKASEGAPACRAAAPSPRLMRSCRVWTCMAQSDDQRDGRRVEQARARRQAEEAAQPAPPVALETLAIGQFARAVGPDR